MPSGVVEGIPYSLPKKAFLISAEYELKECAVTITNHQRPEFTVAVSKTITVTPSTEADELEHFYIPYSALRNEFKDTDITIESYDNQTLKSVSATVNDRTGDVITEVIGTAIRIASVAGGVTLFDKKPGEAIAPQLPSASELRATYCGKEALRGLDQIRALRDKNKTTGEEAGGADRASASAGSDDVPGQIADVKSRYLTHKEVVHWVPRKGATPSDVISTQIYPETFLRRQTWITSAGMEALKSSDEPVLTPDGRISRLITYAALELNEPTQADPTPANMPKGLILRHAASGLLRICEGDCPTGVSGDVSNVLSATEHIVPQLGQYVVLPLKNKLFENQTLAIGLSADGAIIKLGLKSNATAAAGVASINTDLEAINKAKTAQDKARADARAATQNKAKDQADKVKDDNSAVASCLAAQKAVKDAGGTPSGSCQ